MVQGKVRIDTRNVHTGRTQTVEHCNTFQDNIIQSWFNGYGRQGNTPYRFNSDGGGVYNPIWSKLVGGIYLFDQAIPANSVMMPAGTTMVGCGSYGVTNAGTPTELGSYNTVEEIVGDQSLTMVYDYNTSQANGTIASVCLTSDLGGYAGMGFTSGSFGTRKDMMGVQPYSDTSIPYYPMGMDANGIIYATSDNGYTLYQQLTGGTLKLYSWDSHFAKYDLIKSISTGYTATETDIAISGYSISNSTVGASAWIDERYYCFLMLPNGTSVVDGATFTAIIVDTQTSTATWHSCTNTTGHTIYVDTNGTQAWTKYNAMVWIDKDTILINLPDSDSNVLSYTFDLAQNVATSLGQITDMTTITHPVTIVNPTLQLGTGLVYVDSFIYDNTLHRIAPCNGIFQNSDNTNSATRILAVADSGKTFVGSRSQMQTSRMMHNPLMLSTIANLSESVTKTSSLTMKVTYTLTRS